MITENIVINKDFSWVDVFHPLGPDLDFLKSDLKLSPLLVQDCLRPEHLPKYEKTSEGHFFLIHIFDTASKKSDLTIEKMASKVAIFITPERLVTIHKEENLFLRKFLDLRDDENFPDSSMKVIHQLFKISIMSFEEPVMKLQKLYETFETDILSSNIESLSNANVYQFRRKLFIVQGILQMTQAVLNNSRSFWMNASQLQDLKENLDLLHFRLDGLAKNFDQLFELYLAMNDKRSNEVVKLLTVFSSIMLPLTFIASFYGMNFEHIPGLRTMSGFVGAIVLMITITFMTVWYFYRKRWLKLSV